jgi:Tfp pilus assembly protein PilF
MSRSIGNRFGISMACNSLGLVLQKEENPVEAQQMFQESLNISTEMGEKWIIQQSLVNLGFSKLALGEVAEAQVCFLRALRLAAETNLIPCILDSLAGMAGIYAGQGKQEVAMDLVIQIGKNPAVTQDTKARVIKLRAELEAHFTSSQIAAIQAHAAEKTFDAVVEDVLK